MHRQAAVEAAGEQARDGADHGRDGEDEPGRIYDSFVVRVWREARGGRVLRAEVEHVQTAAVATEVGGGPEWIARALTDCLAGLPSGHGGEVRPKPGDAGR